MTTYFPAHMRCPDCNHLFSYMAMGSCNTFGATFYTDGYVDGPMYVDEGQLFICPNCSKLGWNDEFRIDENSPTSEDRFDFSGQSEPVHVDEYPGLLEQKPWRNPGEEKYVRIRAFWAANNHRRLQTENLQPFSRDELDNQERLMGLLDDSPSEQLLHAELLREMACFQECLEMLGCIEDPRLAEYCASIRQLAQEKNFAVSKIPSTN